MYMVNVHVHVHTCSAYIQYTCMYMYTFTVHILYNITYMYMLHVLIQYLLRSPSYIPSKYQWFQATSEILQSSTFHSCPPVYTLCMHVSTNITERYIASCRGSWLVNTRYIHVASIFVLVTPTLAE